MLKDIKCLNIDLAIHRWIKFSVNFKLKLSTKVPYNIQQSKNDINYFLLKKNKIYINLFSLERILIKFLLTIFNFEINVQISSFFFFNENFKKISEKLHLNFIERNTNDVIVCQNSQFKTKADADLLIYLLSHYQCTMHKFIQREFSADWIAL